MPRGINPEFREKIIRSNDFPDQVMPRSPYTLKLPADIKALVQSQGSEWARQTLIEGLKREGLLDAE